jgi:acetyl esterase
VITPANTLAMRYHAHVDPTATSIWRRPRFRRLALAAVGALPSALHRLILGPGREMGGRRLEPDVDLMLGLRERFGWPDSVGMPAPAVRRRGEREALTFAIRPVPGVKMHELSVPGPAGPLAARLYLPQRAADGGPLMLYLHGGGWMAGSLATHDARCRFIARHARIRVLSGSYRLAPEDRFPAAVEDARAALRWALDNAGELGAGRVGVGGDSAGGNLAAVLAREERGRVAFQLLIYPATDLSREYPSYAAFAEAPFLSAREMRWLRGLYLTSEDDARDLRASPLLADDLSGLPPAYVALAGFDPLYDEGLAYATRLREAGTDVTLDRGEGQLHGFAGVIDACPSARAALRDVCRWLSTR